MNDNTFYSAPAGWYPDPLGLPQLRWWDSTQWTHQVAEARQPMVMNETTYKWADEDDDLDQTLRRDRRDRRDPSDVAKPTAQLLLQLEPPVRGTAQESPAGPIRTDAPDASDFGYERTNARPERDESPIFEQLRSQDRHDGPAPSQHDAGFGASSQQSTQQPAGGFTQQPTSGLGQEQPASGFGQGQGSFAQQQSHQQQSQPQQSQQQQSQQPQQQAPFGQQSTPFGQQQQQAPQTPFGGQGTTGTPFGQQQEQGAQPQGFAPFGQPQSQPAPYVQPGQPSQTQASPEFGQFDPQFAQYAQYMQQYAQYLQQAGPQQAQPAAWVPQAGSFLDRPQFRITHTFAVWMIALLPMLQLVLSLLFLTALGVGDSTLMLAVWLVPYPITVFLAWLDERALRNEGRTHTASWLFALLSAPIYLVLRAVASVRETGKGFGPEMVWLGLSALQIGAIVAVPGLAIATAPTVFAAEAEASIVADARLIGATLDVTCPEQPPVLIGQQFECSGVTASGDGLTILVSLDRVNGWIDWRVDDWGIYSIG